MNAYAVATVVGRTPPVSSHVGDRAVIHADGRMDGFIGGSCSRDIIRREALAALRRGEPRLVRIRPDATAETQTREVVTVPMRCISEGAVDVYIEPHLPQPLLILAGHTPVAQALAEIAPALGYRVERFVADDELADIQAFSVDALAEYLVGIDEDVRARSAAVVASQGHYDDVALAAIAAHDLAYVGLVASRARAQSVLAVLESQGVTAERREAIAVPAGLAIGARKPAEVAVSIFAQMISDAAERAPAEERAEEATARSAIDPVCGMTVTADLSRNAMTYDGRTFHFCCAACRATFAQDPERYAAAPST